MDYPSDVTVQQPNTPIYQTLWVRQPSAPAIVIAAVTASALSFCAGALFGSCYDYVTTTLEKKAKEKAQKERS
jgi:hypothetical protein